ncbi:MAG TPA: hypothetical protein VGF29_09075 [Hyphomicrobiaceae bacterium]
MFTRSRSQKARSAGFSAGRTPQPMRRRPELEHAQIAPGNLGLTMSARQPDAASWWRGCGVWMAEAEI